MSLLSILINNKIVQNDISTEMLVEYQDIISHINYIFGRLQSNNGRYQRTRLEIYRMAKRSFNKEIKQYVRKYIFTEVEQFKLSSRIDIKCPNKTISLITKLAFVWFKTNYFYFQAI